MPSSVVATAGADVSTVEVGQEVYGLMERSRSSSFAENAIAKSNAIAPKPKSLSYLEAALIPAAVLTLRVVAGLC